MTFKDFKASTPLGLKNSIIGTSFYQPDYTPKVTAKDTRFINVEKDSIAYIRPPEVGWANIKDFGNFPCTGPQNVLFSFTNTTWIDQNTDMAKDF